MHVIGARASVFFFNDTATTEIYTLSLHDALPIFPNPDEAVPSFVSGAMAKAGKGLLEGTLQALAIAPETKIGRAVSRNAETDLVCRLLLETKTKTSARNTFLHA